MKKLLVFSAILALCSLSAKAQSIGTLTDFLGPLASATNHQFGGGLLYNQTLKKAGAYIEDRYNFNGSTFFGLNLRLQGTLPNTVDGVAGTVQAQLPVTISTNLFGLGRVGGAPFTGAGLMTHWSGFGVKNGSAEPVIDAGISGSIGSHWGVKGMYETETISNYKLWLIGPTFNLGATNSGFLGIFGHASPDYTHGAIAHRRNRYDTKDYLSRVNRQVETD